MPALRPDVTGHLKMYHPAVRDDSQGKNNEIVEGVRDKRLLVFEGEFAQVLRVMRRDGNTLSGILRNAWDGRPWGT